MKADSRKKAYRWGIHAEKWAAAYLTCKGYRILASRYRNAQGEIDLIALKRKTLIAVEVKARQQFKDCEESVTAMKQRKIARAVEGLLAGRGKFAGLVQARADNIRFDVIWVVPWRLPRHLKDAWRL